MTLFARIREVWCLLTHRCTVDVARDDAFMGWLRDQEHEAMKNANEQRQRRANVLEQAVLQRRFDEVGRRRRGEGRT